jgi:hypothetical protein
MKTISGSDGLDLKGHLLSHCHSNFCLYTAKNGDKNNGDIALQTLLHATNLFFCNFPFGSELSL